MARGRPPKEKKIEDIISTSGRDEIGRFAKGNTAFLNRNYAASPEALMKYYGEERFNEFLDKMYELALMGDSGAIRFLGDRWLPIARGRLTQMDIDINHTSLKDILSTIVNSMFKGIVTSEEATSMLGTIEKKMIIESVDVEKQLIELKREVNALSEKFGI